jgi:CRP/FNR family transcriptional regulator, cyclic AMP receptor protein
MTKNIIQDLAQADLFMDFDELLLELVASICHERVYQYEQKIFEENSDSDELYVIARGEVEIRVNTGIIRADDEEEYQTLTTLRQGQNFGEVALLDQGRRSAAAFCTENNSRLIVIPRDRIEVMCNNVPKLGYALMRNIALDLAMKIRHTDLEIRERLTWMPSERG